MRFGQSMTRLLNEAIDLMLNRFGYMFFLAAGVISVVASALIEYKVVSGFLPSQTGESFSLIAFFVVFAAEMVKVFSIYLHKQYMISGNPEYRKGNIYNLLRSALITLSVVCTLIFLFHQLHNPEYEKQVSRAISDAAAEYDRRRDNINADFNKRIQGIGGEVGAWQKQLAAEAQDVRGGIAQGASFRAYKLLYDEAVNGLNSRRIRLEHERAERISALERWHEQEVAGAKERLRTDSSSHNPMISAVLQIVIGSPQYPMRYYMLAIVLFSLLVSVVLELIIVYVFHVLAVNNGDMLEMVRKPVQA